MAYVEVMTIKSISIQFRGQSRYNVHLAIVVRWSVSIGLHSTLGMFHCTFGLSDRF